MVRHVFFCIDGTLAQSETDTNIWKIFQLVGGADNPDAWYQEGIASLSTARYLQTILPTEIYTEAYQQYKMLDALQISPEDRLYIFGYSRGAIVARILAQMITSDVARTSVIRSADHVTNVPRNTVDFLGLFDPVRGRPYPMRLRGFEEDAYENTSIQNISEIISLDDAFPFFRPDAYLAVKSKSQKKDGIKKRLRGLRERSDEKASVNRTATRVTSRHYCLLPGVHNDIGGQRSNVALSRISLLQILTDLFSAFPDVRERFNNDSIDSLYRELEIHNNILVGEGSSFMRQVLRLPRKFSSDPNATVHPLVVELNGQKNVSRHVIGGRWRRYNVPKYYLKWPHTAV